MSGLSAMAGGVYQGAKGMFVSVSQGAFDSKSSLGNIGNVSTLAKVGQRFIEVKETFFGMVPTLSEKAYQTSVGYLEGWKALADLPNTVMECAEKVGKFFQRGTVALGLDCAEAVANVANTVYDAVEFMEKKMSVSLFQGFADTYETPNFQALVVGAGVRTATAAQKVWDYLSGNSWASSKQAFGDGLDLVKNGADLTFAGAMLASAGSQYTVGASAVSAACKATKYFYEIK